ncbi:OsmC family protein [Listeria fleischmannii 1991]|uniref:Peroxiredoxin, OsmC subfamily n=2 Tax=Listeria fleischmannii TaxID=1069827 RepID=A0A2X3HHM5_9LIST|nr:OsmC family protein [Listeria fleischmannii]EMG29167.1 OsmC/Ohr family protein [Listeria fleischmannii subsp. fleischmannii LU2006-1]KMT58881.1 OsmC family protein [Listeria fleischmannii 1991]SQC72147.1 peroxiredoxin, OsmC subfamily [Listeria fleischmannii subsp. fleischmannii]
MHLKKVGEKIELQHETGNWPLIKEEGFSPVQITVAAVAACSAYVYAKLLDKKRIPYEDLDVDVSYEQDLEQAVHVIKKIDVNFQVKVAKEYQEKAEKAVHLVKNGCPVARSMHPDIQITEHVTFL